MKSDLRTALTLLAILVIAALLNGFALPIAGRNVRPEHVAGPIAFVWLAAWRMSRREPVIRIDAFSTLAVGWVLVNALSSWLYAPQPAESFVHVFRLGLLVIIFLTVANLPFSDSAQWTSGVRLWLGLALVELGYGGASWLLAQYGGIWAPGTYYEPLIGGISVSGTQLERNFFGILAGTVLATAAYCLFAQRVRQRMLVASSGFLLTTCTLAGLMTVIALTRSAWIAVVIVGPLAYLVFDRRRLRHVDRPLLHTAVALPVLLVAFTGVSRIVPAPVSHPAAAPAQARATGSVPSRPPARVVQDRVMTLGRLESDFTTNTRIQDARWAIADWRRSPVLGHGTGSFVQLHGIRVGTEAWISNLVLHTLVDTGLAGLLVQMSLFTVAVRRAWRMSRSTRSARLDVGLKGLTLGLLVALVAYQVTDGTWLAFVWVHLGLMVNATAGLADSRAAVESAQEMSFPPTGSSPAD
jgi:hypothetical protein